ncbi:MAG: multicopper oxidase domain-containing protein [Nitrosomonas sp.]|nr:multicopper oxidase domain-containing protein [Nitrosomonas sp.]
MKSELEYEFQPGSCQALYMPKHPTKLKLASWLILATMLMGLGGMTSVLAGNTHQIKMVAEEVDPTGNLGLFAYRMMQHQVVDSNGNTVDLSGNYSTVATIPGPTIVMTEGDVAEIELMHQFNPDNPKQEHVSLHVHGVHYDKESDGTLKYINLYKDESATPVLSYNYRWIAAPGTTGTWAYHDHNMNSHNGAEDRGLFGALIVNPASGLLLQDINGTGSGNALLSQIQKEFVLYIGDDAFWGMEINNANGVQTALGANPNLNAQLNSDIRIHLIALGTNFPQFELPSYTWIDPGTRRRISAKTIGPLEKHVFAINASQSASYLDTAFSSKLLGMKGQLIVD